jgi:SAM-dependent methyltransferase
MMEATNAAPNSASSKLRNFYRDLCFRVKHPIAQGIRKLKVQPYLSRLAGKRAIEIGGPSDIFRDEGALPVYGVLGSVDNCLYSHRTIWTETVSPGETFRYDSRKPPGTQYICEATELKPVADQSYECVLASHCLEHVANPLRALAEWKRILKKDGLLLLVLPHKDGTFDWRRPVTTLTHMTEDYEKQIGEDDLTHLPEILALHDLEKDPPAGPPEQFRARSLENEVIRALHHHVFNAPTAVQLVDRANFQLVRVNTFRPFHIVILGRSCGEAPKNARFLGAGAKYRRSSPFPSDRTQT